MLFCFAITVLFAEAEVDEIEGAGLLVEADEKVLGFDITMKIILRM